MERGAVAGTMCACGSSPAELLGGVYALHDRHQHRARPAAKVVAAAPAAARDTRPFGASLEALAASAATPFVQRLLGAFGSTVTNEVRANEAEAMAPFPEAVAPFLRMLGAPRAALAVAGGHPHRGQGTCTSWITSTITTAMWGALRCGGDDDEEEEDTAMAIEDDGAAAARRRRDGGAGGVCSRPGDASCHVHVPSHGGRRPRADQHVPPARRGGRGERPLCTGRRRVRRYGAGPHQGGAREVQRRPPPH